MNEPIVMLGGARRAGLVHDDADPERRGWALALAYVACSLALAVVALFFVGGMGSRAEAATDRYQGASWPDAGSHVDVMNSSELPGGAQVMAFWSNGYTERQVTFSEEKTTVRIHADTDQICNGAYPKIELRDNGVLKATITVTNSSYTVYSATLSSPIPSGSRTIRLTFPNDYHADGCDRNAFVDWVEFVDAPAPPPPDSGSLMFQDRFERSFDSANMGGGGSASANNGLVPLWDWGNAAASDRITPSTSVTRVPGGQSAKFTVHTGDRSPGTTSENPRAQLNYGAGSNGRFCEGHERWIAWSQYHPAGFTDHGWGDWTQLATIGWGHPYGLTQSPISMAIDNWTNGSDRIRMSINGTVGWQESLQRNGWYDFTYHIKFSRDSSVGFIEFWKNGQRVTFINGQTKFFTNTLPITNAPYCGNLQLPNYFRYGQTSVQTIYYDEVKVGTSYAAVQPGS